MLKHLIIANLKQRLFYYGVPSASSMRWRPVFVFVLEEILGVDCTTKNGKKVAKTLDLNEFDFEQLSDEKLVEFSELVYRRFYVCM